MAKKNHGEEFNVNPVYPEMHGGDTFDQIKENLFKQNKVGVVRLLGMSSSPPKKIPSAINGSLWLVLDENKVKPRWYREGKWYEQKVETKTIYITQSS